MRRAPLLTLVAVNLALLLMLAALWLTPQGRLRNVQWQPPAPVKPALGGAAPLERWSTDYSRFVATLERPLFSETRRPPPKAQAQPVDTLSTVTIVGIWGTGAQAGVIAREGQQMRRVKVGEPLAGWTLKEVRLQGATFARGDETRSLLIRRGAAPSTP
jgi:hypothetical protein